MRIIHVVRQFHPSVGGLEDYVENLALEQLAAGHTACVMTLNSEFQTGERLPAHEHLHGIEVTRVPWRGSQRYPLCRLDVQALNSADIVHVHAIDSFIDALSALKRLGVLKSNLVVSTHGGFFHTAQNQQLKRLYFQTVTRFSLARASAVLSCSLNDQALFSSICRRAQLINNGVRLHKFGAPALAVPTQDMVYLGRFSPNKRLAWLIGAYATLPNPRGKLKIIGRSKTGDIAPLTALIERLGCASRVELILNIDDAQIVRHLCSSRFTVSASDYEGFGLGVIELMSYGLTPLLSWAPPSFCDFIGGSGCGEGFDYSFESFHQAYTELVEQWSPEAAQRARAYADRFSWVAVARDIFKVYQSVLSQGSSRSRQGVVS